MSSPASSLASLPDRERSQWLENLTDKQGAALSYDWSFWARPEQLPPDTIWQTWLILAGRGWGKTRTAAEWIRKQAEKPGVRIALVGRTAADVRDVMVEGVSGILNISPLWDRPRYEPSKRRLTWDNGTTATTYSADEPNLLRGPQHHFAWADEIAAWSYPDAWDQMQLGLRLGTDPRCVVSTTPRPIKLIRDLLLDPSTVITKGSTYDNRENLPHVFFQRIVEKYEGTRLGRQEIYAEILEEIPGALWTRKMIDDNRVHDDPELERVVVGIDPAITSKSKSNETGIIVAGRNKKGQRYVLADKSLRASPDGWARAAVNAYKDFMADRIVVEVNQGGEMVERVIRTIDADVPIRSVHASRGKVARAEPIAALYEQGLVSHVGILDQLEDQMVMFTNDGKFLTSPDRCDALVWALTELGTSSRRRGRLDLDSDIGFRESPWGV